MQRIPLKTIFPMIGDSVNAIFLGVYALLLGPLGVLRGPLLIERTVAYILVLSPLGLLSRFVRVAINWRLGHFDIAISEAQEIATRLEGSIREQPNSSSRRRILQDLYTLIARASLHIGRIDDAMRVVLQAKKTIGVDRLPGLSELNSKTAHLIRAGLSAGRLLDGGGLATLFVKAPNPPNEGRSSDVRSLKNQDDGADKTPEDRNAAGGRQGASSIAKDRRSEDIALNNVIQFPIGGAQNARNSTETD